MTNRVLQSGCDRDAQCHERVVLERVSSYSAPLGQYNPSVRNQLVHGSPLCPTLYAIPSKPLLHSSTKLERVASGALDKHTGHVRLPSCGILITADRLLDSSTRYSSSSKEEYTYQNL